MKFENKYIPDRFYVNCFFLLCQDFLYLLAQWYNKMTAFYHVFIKKLPQEHKKPVSLLRKELLTALIYQLLLHKQNGF